MKNKISYLVLGAFLMGAAVECGAFDVAFDFNGVVDARAAAFAENRNPGVRPGDVNLAVHDGHIGILDAANDADLAASRAIRGVIVPNAVVALANGAAPAAKHVEMPYGDNAANWGANNNAVVTDKLAEYMLESWLGALAGDARTLNSIYCDVFSRLAARVCSEKARNGESFAAYLGNQPANKLSFIKDIIRAIGDEEQNFFRELLLEHAKGYHAAAFPGVQFDEAKMKTALAHIKFGIVAGQVNNIAVNDAVIQEALREQYNADGGVRATGVLAHFAAESERVYERNLARRNENLRRTILRNGNPVQQPGTGDGNGRQNDEELNGGADKVTVMYNGKQTTMTQKQSEDFKKLGKFEKSQMAKKFSWN